jgi:hypothetical protein
MIPFSDIVTCFVNIRELQLDANTGHVFMQFSKTNTLTSHLKALPAWRLETSRDIRRFFSLTCGALVDSVVQQRSVW